MSLLNENADKRYDAENGPDIKDRMRVPTGMLANVQTGAASIQMHIQNFRAQPLADRNCWISVIHHLEYSP